MSSNIPIIDLALYDNAEDLSVELEKSLETGFIFLKNHNLPADKMFNLSQDFFMNELIEEKQLSSIVNNKGYASIGKEALDPSKEPQGDFKEVFNIGIIKSTSTNTQRLPSILLNKIEEIAQFQLACHLICQRLLEAFALILKVNKDFFTSEHSNSILNPSILRLLHYPAILPDVERVIEMDRAGAHSDYGSMTLLFQNSEPSETGDGLQILPSTSKDDNSNWKNVGVVEGAVLVNVGDALEFWSGAKFKSTLHRVRLPSPIPIEGIAERYSIAYFNQPNPDAILKSIVETDSISEIDLERMERKGVKPGISVTALEHLNARLNATYNLA